MSQRLTMHHPKTGAILEPLYFSAVRGRYVWPIMGASPDDDSNSGGAGDDGKNSGEGTGSEGQENSGDDKGGEGEDDQGKGEDAEAYKRRMQAADRRASAAEAELQKYKDKEKSAEEKANDKVKESETNLAEANKTIKTLRLQNAFLVADDQSWHDPETALDLAESKGYLVDVVEDDGTINKKLLAAALKKLATDKPFLVKKKSDEGSGGSGASGGDVGGGRGSGGKIDEATLRRKYPALNR